MQIRQKTGVCWLNAVAVSVMLLAISGCASNPPYQEMSDARQAINAALESDAQKLSPRLVRLAKRHLKNARIAMKERRFNAARNEAVLAHRKATEALQRVQTDSP